MSCLKKRRTLALHNESQPQIITFSTNDKLTQHYSQPTQVSPRWPMHLNSSTIKFEATQIKITLEALC